MRSLAEICNCEIHPIINRRVGLYLVDDLGHTPEEVAQWLAHWCGKSFATLERLLGNDSATGRYCHGDTPTVADIYLVSLLSAAQIYNVDVSSYTTLLRIEAGCLEIPEFRERLPRLLAA